MRRLLALLLALACLLALGAGCAKRTEPVRADREETEEEPPAQTAAETEEAGDTSAPGKEEPAKEPDAGPAEEPKPLSAGEDLNWMNMSGAWGYVCADEDGTWFVDPSAAFELCYLTADGAVTRYPEAGLVTDLVLVDGDLIYLSAPTEEGTLSLNCRSGDRGKITVLYTFEGRAFQDIYLTGRVGGLLYYADSALGCTYAFDPAKLTLDTYALDSWYVDESGLYYTTGEDGEERVAMRAEHGSMKTEPAFRDQALCYLGTRDGLLYYSSLATDGESVSLKTYDEQTGDVETLIKLEESATMPFVFAVHEDTAYAVTAGEVLACDLRTGEQRALCGLPCDPLETWLALPGTTADGSLLLACSSGVFYLPAGATAFQALSD